LIFAHFNVLCHLAAKKNVSFAITLHEIVEKVHEVRVDPHHQFPQETAFPRGNEIIKEKQHFPKAKTSFCWSISKDFEENLIHKLGVCLLYTSHT
jgi:hypothetical protein